MAITIVVATTTALVLLLAERRAAAAVAENLQREFHAQVQALQRVQAVRRSALLSLSQALVEKARIRAAFEDDALDLLYPSALDELGQLWAASPENAPASALQAAFCRFLDASGRVIAPNSEAAVGVLKPGDEVGLALPTLPPTQQLGYLSAQAEDGSSRLCEIIATPIVSMESGQVMSAVVLGFELPTVDHAAPGFREGIWAHGRLLLPGLDAQSLGLLEQELAARLRRQGHGEFRMELELAGEAQLLFCQQINAGSMYAPAFQVCVYSLAGLQLRQRELRWQIVGVGVVLALAGLLLSRVLAARLSTPVEKLARHADQSVAERRRAEEALKHKDEELLRAARFSADASHQLKTPVTVLRLGLEEMLTRPSLSREQSEEISALIHQTYRLSGVVDDLLLLSMMDAGRLELERVPVDLTQLVGRWLDDMSAIPEPFGLSVDTRISDGLIVLGAERYTDIIFQNLLENARKYNRRGGRIEVAARRELNRVHVTIGNTGNPIPLAAQEHIFDRFHRGSAGENVPGHGLGLNLARELARVHGGDLRLAGSREDWTEFELTLLAWEPRTVNGGAP